MEAEYYRALRDNPSNDVAWQQYADWLLERDHSRGEFIQLLLESGLPANLYCSPDWADRFRSFEGVVDTNWLEKMIALRAVIGGARPSVNDIDAFWSELQIERLPEIPLNMATSFKPLERLLAKPLRMKFLLTTFISADAARTVN